MTSKPSPLAPADLEGSSSWALYLASLAFSNPRWYSVADGNEQIQTRQNNTKTFWLWWVEENQSVFDYFWLLINNQIRCHQLKMCRDKHLAENLLITELTISQWWPFITFIFLCPSDFSLYFRNFLQNAHCDSSNRQPIHTLKEKILIETCHHTVSFLATQLTNNT